MKFGKRMRSLAARGWERDYVDYKQLKKTIHALLARQTDEHSDAPSPSDAFLAALTREAQRLNAAHDRIHTKLFDQELRVLQTALGNRWVLSPAQARALLLGAIELSTKVDAFRRFIVLNSLAVVKITKKFDKLFPEAPLKHVVMEELLKAQPFYDCAAMDALCGAVAALTDRIMLCVLPDGNFRMSDARVACPICLQREAKSAITLSCKHSFCWSCLSKAAEHRFHSCPLCRKEQSIDPRDYAIDGLLMRFKRAYDFVEATLDRGPLAASPMRQILIEAFDTVNAHVREVEAKYAALSPRPSLHAVAADDEPMAASKMVVEDLHADADAPTIADLKQPSPCADVESAPTVFARGAAVEVHYNGQWYPGMVLHENDDDHATYSVLWWMHDQSQRCGQRMPCRLLREPVFSDNDPSQYVLFDFAAGAWKTAAEWAMLPFRRLRSLSMSDTSSLQGNTSVA